MTLDGRDGAIGMAVNRSITGEIPSDLIQACKRSIYVNDNSFDDRINDLIYQAIDYFETATATSVLFGQITIEFEYFKGEVRLPFGPFAGVFSINGIEPERGVDFPLPIIYEVDSDIIGGGDCGKLQVIYLAGYNSTAGIATGSIPIQIQSLITRLFQVFWREDTEVKVPIGLQKQIAKYRKRID